jgi:hypothetical protein
MSLYRVIRLTPVSTALVSSVCIPLPLIISAELPECFYLLLRPRCISLTAKLPDVLSVIFAKRALTCVYGVKACSTCGLTCGSVGLVARISSCAPFGVLPRRLRAGRGMLRHIDSIQSVMPPEC